MFKLKMLDRIYMCPGETGGTEYSQPFDMDGVETLQSISAYLVCGNVEGTTPTLDVSFEHSFDLIHWYDTGKAFTQVTDEEHADEAINWSVDEHPFDPPYANFGPNMRVKCVVGGSDSPAYDVVVYFSSIGSAWFPDAEQVDTTPPPEEPE